LALIKSQIGI